MSTNYLKIAIRNVLRHKGYSFVIIAGLAVGMACCILLLLYVQHELSYDQFNQDHSQIYRLVAERKAAEGISQDLTMPPPLAPAMLADFPQVTQAVRFLSIDNPIPLVGNSETRFYERRLFFADPSAFRVFTIPFLQGDVQAALEKPNTVVITEEMARKYFGEKDPLGRTLSVNNYLSLEVTGVVKDFPSNSTLQPDFLVSFSTLTNWLGKDFVNSWQNNTCQIYLLLAENTSAEAVAPQLPKLIDRYLGKNSSLKKLHLQPLDRIHLYSFEDYGLTSPGDIHYVYLLSAVAVFILLVASVNSANLTTARLVFRSKEIGVRKLIGASRKQLVQQFLCEAILSTFIALAMAIALVEISIPFLDAVVGRELTGRYAADWQTWFGPIGIVFFIAFSSASYPAFLFSSLKPIDSLKGYAKAGSGRVLLRKGMVVIQFALTVTLMIGTWVVYDQLRFMQNKQLGFDKDQVVVVPIRDQNLRQNPEALKHRLLQDPGILQVGAAALLPGGPVGRTRFRAEGMTDIGTMSMLWVDHDFVTTLDLKLAAGRDFFSTYPADASEAFILNEQAVKQLGWTKPEDAIGKTFEVLGGKKGHVVGVVRDFHFVSLHSKIKPLVLHLWPWMNYLLVRIDASHVSSVLSNMGNIWREFDPDNPFTFTFLSDNFDRYYRSDKQLGQIFGSFTLLAILVACTGLLSLAAYTAEQRTKEIGVRKVLGASVPSIIGLLTREYIWLVVLANLLAWPVAYYAMNQWLQDFAYRISVGLGAFLLAGGVALLIAVLTVSYQATKAAIANPVEALRYE
jgi:putative ABC transport system permease protein